MESSTRKHSTLDLLDYHGASRALSVAIGTLHCWVSRGQIPHIRLSPRLVRFERVVLEAWLAARRVDASEPIEVHQRKHTRRKWRVRRGSK
jgi:hypothetical protein